LAKPELGTKRVCPNCGTKYYDLHRDPITCPNCGTIFEITARERAAPQRVAVAPVISEEAEPEAVVDADPVLVSLEEVEADAEPDVGPDADEEEAVIPDAETIEIEADIETDDDAAFLPEEEEEGDDVAGLLDVEGEDEDEV
jgi:uncharacterized protein (TIGR02300 family)